MSLHDRLRGLGISADRMRSIGVEPPAKSTEPRTDGVNPAGVQRSADRQRARELAERAVSDIAAWRQYRDAADPFTRARLGQGNRAAIERGRELDVDDEPGVTPENVSEQAGAALAMIDSVRSRTNGGDNNPPPAAA